MRFKVFSIILSLLFVFELEAQNIKGGFTLEANIPQTSGTLYLGHYWRGKPYAIDSVTIFDGKATFTRQTQPEAGEYFLHSKSGLFISLLIDKGQNNIHVSIDESDALRNSVTGSEDTRLLWKYFRLKQNEKDTTKLQQLNDSISDLLAANSGTWFASFVRGSMPIPLPYPNPQDANEFYANKHHGKAHYFDNIDLTDPRMWRTSYLTSFIDTYMKEWIDYVPDSLAIAASRLVAKTKSNDFCFKEMLSYLTNTSLKSNKMGDENIWAKLYEDYMLDKDMSWITPNELSELKRKYELIKTNRIGMTARSLPLKTMDDKLINTGEIEADYLILYFYNHDCSHCSVELPKVHDLYNAYKDKGVKVVAVDINNNKEKTLNYIDKHKLNDWINCMDPDYKSKFWLYYNTSATPSVYIIDKQKKIIAKDVDSQAIKQVLKYYIK